MWCDSRSPLDDKLITTRQHGHQYLPQKREGT